MQKAVSVQIPALEVIKDGILVYYVTCFLQKLQKKLAKVTLTYVRYWITLTLRVLILYIVNCNKVKNIPVVKQIISPLQAKDTIEDAL